MKDFDFSGWATKNNLLCSDNRTILKDAFKHQDSKTVPLVWMHQHSDPANVLGHALLKNRDEGVYAYCKFNETESGKLAKQLVEAGDVSALSIHATRLKQTAGNVTHGTITEVSLVLAGANPGAYIDSIVCHGEESDEEAIIYTGEDIELAHSEDEAESEEELVEEVTEEETPVEETPVEEEPEIEHADGEKKNKADDDGEGTKKEDTPNMAEEKKTAEQEKEKTVKDVFDTFTEEQKTVVYALIGQALEDAGVDADEDEEEAKHYMEGDSIMHANIFDRDERTEVGVLSHAAQEEIINLAKQSNVGSLKMAMEIYAEKNGDTLAHGIDEIDQLFPDFRDVHPGAPELLERDHGWVGHVMAKAHKSPISRVRTRQLDARAAEIKAKGYSNREEQKALSGNLKLLSRNTDPQTIYYRDALHRDDIVDITDFDVVAYQRNVMKRALEEEIALAALVGDGREDTDPDKIHEDHIRPIWKDEDLYTIKAPVDLEAMAASLQGTDTSAHFGEEFIFMESVIKASLDARIKYKGKGALDFFCAPATLNKMLLARDMNGRRIYDSISDVAKALNVSNIFTVEQFADVAPRENKTGEKFELLGLFVNMANYQFGATKGGEITNFEDFDIDFNQYKYLMETRLSGALTEVYSAIALEKPLVEVAG